MGVYVPTEEDRELVKDIVSNYCLTFTNMFIHEDLIVHSEIPGEPRDEIYMRWTIRYLKALNPRYAEIIKEESQ